MQNQVTFHGENRGTQIGINTGTVTIHEDPPLVALDKLLSSAPQAAFDARESEHEERCLPGTRVEVLRDIHAWATSSKNEKCIFWLCGAAGTGKSTISRSIAQAFEDTKSLGASFFFKRGETDRGSAAKLFTTLAKQLAMSVPGLFSHIIAAASDDPGISEKGMKIQFEKIILEPLQKLDESGDLKETIRIVLVIDALDECDRDEDILPMIQLLSQLKRIIAVQLRVFLTSRPELPVRLGFKKLADEDHEDLVLHRISRSVIGHDIALFLNHQISEIRTARDQPLPMDWPGEEAMKKLVDLCVPLFIFAATICRIFRDDSWDPYESLPEILAQQKTSDADNLDGTYLPVLNRILRGVDTKRQQRVIVDFQHIVGTIVLLETPLSVSSLSKLLDLPVSRISFRLGQLHSVLRIPDDETLPVRPFHLSFRDFLLDPEIRAKTPLSIDEKMSHYELTLRCFALAQGLRRNICALPSDGTEQSEIDYDVVRKLFPPELQYACRYWAHHLVGCLGLGDEMASVNALDEALIFLYQHFLHWLEAMTLLKLSSEVVGILNLLASNITTEQYPVLFEFLQDAKRFVLKNRSITDQYPLQIYCTGLIFAPQTAVRRGFRSELPKSICQLPRVDQSWSTELQSLEGHTGSIVSVEFSPDGKLLVSSSPGYSPRTQDVRLWDVTTGSLLQNYTENSDYNSSAGFSPDGKLLAFSSESAVQLWDITQDEEFMTLKRESNIVTPTGFSPHVLFSPDGKLLASILVDGNVQLWNVNSGQLDKSLEHTKFTWNNATSHMAFSSDSRQLASTAADGKTRLWDVSTGELKQTFLEQSEEHWSEFFFEAEGETSTAHSVAFSIDSRFLACGSDKTVRIWNISTGQIHHKFEGHTQSVFSVAFSRDGRLLATGSADKTVRVWNLQERTLLQTLTGHSSSVVSVAFSPDSGLLASGSHDRTVKIWDVTAKPPVQALAGHSKEVNLLVMSPDALILASASTDQSIKLWDIRKGTVRHTLKVYSDALEYTYALDDSVELMVFSPDGSLLASLVYKTIQIWDVGTGTLKHTLNGHEESVRSLVFSPDSELLASCSNDHTIRLWDVTAGSYQTLKGHDSFVLVASFSPDGKSLASGSSDCTVRIWDVITGTVLQTLKEKPEPIRSLAFSPKSSLTLATAGSRDGAVVLWDLAIGKPRQILEGQHDSARLVLFSPDEQFIVSSTGSVVRMWTHGTGALQQSWTFEDDITNLRFSQDGLSLITNLGSYNIPSNSSSNPSDLRAVEMKIAVASRKWVILKGQKALWLPPEFRPGSPADRPAEESKHAGCFVTDGKRLALGHSSGWVSFMSFEI